MLKTRQVIPAARIREFERSKKRLRDLRLILSGLERQAEELEAENRREGREIEEALAAGAVVE